jgi:hypothetical protein
MTERQGGRRSRRQVLQGWPGPLDGGKRSGRFLRRCKGNQQDQNGTGGDELERRGGSPAAASSRIPVDTEAQGFGAELGELRDGEGKLLRGIWRSEARRGGWTTVGPR